MEQYQRDFYEKDQLSAEDGMEMFADLEKRLSESDRYARYIPSDLQNNILNNLSLKKAVTKSYLETQVVA
jgi:hypothetical protein